MYFDQVLDEWMEGTRKEYFSYTDGELSRLNDWVDKKKLNKAQFKHIENHKLDWKEVEKMHNARLDSHFVSREMGLLTFGNSKFIQWNCR